MRSIYRAGVIDLFENLDPPEALCGGISKVICLETLSSFGDKCPQNGSKHGLRAPRTGMGCPHIGPSVDKFSSHQVAGGQLRRRRRISGPLGPLGFNFSQLGPTTRPSRRKDCRESICASGSRLALQCRGSCRGDSGWLCWGI